MKKSIITILLILMGITQVALPKESSDKIFENKFLSIVTIENKGMININNIAKSIESVDIKNKKMIVLLLDPSKLLTKEIDNLENVKIVIIEFK